MRFDDMHYRKLLCLLRLFLCHVSFPSLLFSLLFFTRSIPLVSYRSTDGIAKAFEEALAQSEDGATYRLFQCAYFLRAGNRAFACRALFSLIRGGEAAFIHTCFPYPLTHLSAGARGFPPQSEAGLGARAEEKIHKKTNSGICFALQSIN
ncbi:hypothetical protein IWX49DRAFT_246308 [Phyllosticta citricarpa]